MTADAPQPKALTIAAGGSYAARLVAAGGGDGWCPERWTLDGPEPYAVRLPGGQPEDRHTEVMPLADGRVLISRRADGRYHLALLYPSGPDTGELALGAVQCERLTLLPPAPDGARVYALAPQTGGDEPGTALWLVCGGAPPGASGAWEVSPGPELVTVLAGGCSGGAWLDAAGRMLALDRTDSSGRTRTVTVDVEHSGEPSELLRIAEDSNDRLLLADPDSGLLLVRSDAPGTDRIGWGVLGSERPVRFPEALHPEGVRVEPFAVQPGQVLMPERAGVALRLTTADADWVAVWRPQQRELQHVAAPQGWLAGVGLWTADGELRLPYVSEQTPCGLSGLAVPVPQTDAVPSSGARTEEAQAPVPGPAADAAESAPPAGAQAVTQAVTKPVPLQQAPLARVG